MALKRTGFRVIPTDVREWGRFFSQIEVTADDNTVDADTIVDGSVNTDKISDSAVSTAKIVDQSVTLAKVAQISADRILGKLSSDGSPEELTADQVVSLLEGSTWNFSSSIGFFGVTAISQPSHIADAQTSHTLNSTFDNSEVESALDALGGKINSVIAVLEALGLKADS